MWVPNRGVRAGSPLHQQEWWFKGSDVEREAVGDAQSTGRPQPPSQGRGIPAPSPMHRHRPAFVSVRQSLPLSWQQARCPATSLAITLLEPGGFSGQQRSVGSHACLRPLPVQALGKGKEGAEEGGWGMPAERERPFVMELGSPKARPGPGKAEINSQRALKFFDALKAQWTLGGRSGGDRVLGYLCRKHRRNPTPCSRNPRPLALQRLRHLQTPAASGRVQVREIWASPSGKLPQDL